MPASNLLDRMRKDREHDARTDVYNPPAYAPSVPADCRVEFMEHGSGTAGAFDTSSPAFQKTQGGLAPDGRDDGPTSTDVGLLHELSGVDEAQEALVAEGLANPGADAPHEYRAAAEKARQDGLGRFSS